MKTSIKFNDSKQFLLTRKGNYYYFLRELYFPSFLGGKIFFRIHRTIKTMNGEKVKIIKLQLRNKRSFILYKANSLWDIEGKVVRCYVNKRTLYLYKIAIELK